MKRFNGNKVQQKIQKRKKKHPSENDLHYLNTSDANPLQSGCSNFFFSKAFPLTINSKKIPRYNIKNGISAVVYLIQEAITLHLLTFIVLVKRSALVFSFPGMRQKAHFISI